MWKFLVALICAFSIFWIAPAKAYKPENHIAITVHAWPTFRECLKDWGLGDHQIYRLSSKYLEAAMTMETWYEDKSHLIRRGKNWHFLRADYTDKLYIPEISIFDSIKSYILDLFNFSVSNKKEKEEKDLKIHMSITKLFKKIEKEWKKNAGPLPKDREELIESFKLAGRALHHVEDATVPAHVVPVYHGPSIPRMGKERDVPLFKQIPDEIDAYPGPHGLEPDLQKFPKACDAALDNAKKAGASANPMQEILKKTAAKTRESLGRPINEKKFGKSLTWHFFWKGPSDRFFGKYNIPTKGWDGDITKVDCAKSTGGGLFGNPDICFGGQHLKISQSTYKDFVQARLDEALTADVAMLYVMFLSPGP